MAQRSNVATVPVHCYTNPSFCIQSELAPQGQRVNESASEASSPSPPPPPPPPLPPPYEAEEILPPPPPSSYAISAHQHRTKVYGQSNPAFLGLPENPNVLYATQRQQYEAVHRYDYPLDGIAAPSAPTIAHHRYGSVPVQEARLDCSRQASRYEYIQQEEPKIHQQLQRRASSRYEVSGQQILQRTPVAQENTSLKQSQAQGCRSNGPRYAVVPGDEPYEDEGPVWNTGTTSPARRQIRTPRGCYTSVQQVEPPTLPDRNLQEPSTTARSNLATQKLHEILTTPRKPRSRSAERTMSPRRQHAIPHTGTPRRRAFTPNGSPTGRTLSPSHRETPHGTPRGRAFSPAELKSSTPNKEPSARRCLPLAEHSSRQQDIYERDKSQYTDTYMPHATDHAEAHSRYARTENGAETMSLVTASPRYQITPANHRRTDYLNVESAFMAKTAVVPPLSPPNSEANTTLMSGMEKMDRKNAPFLLILVGILTCGLAIYLSWSQGRRYYFDSAIGCGACCTVAGACRSLRRTWTGVGLAGLSALSCAGLLLLAAGAPRPGTPLHDVTAGALCGVSLLGASLALLTLLVPKCRFTRHRRVHNWIPQLSSS